MTFASIPPLRPVSLAMKSPLSHRHDAAIAQQTQSFGWRMYVSNADAVRLCFAQAVSAYRDEWLVENDFHRLKGKPLGARPVFVRRDDQIQGLMHLLSLALRVYCFD